MIDQLKKPDEYKSVASLKHFVLLDPNRAHALIWSRGPEGWSSTEVISLDATVDLASLDLRLPLAEIYEGAVLAEND